MPTSVQENYLKALYLLSQENGQINITELSKRLSVSKPTASNMIKSLQEGGWVDYQKYKPVTLTNDGRIAAASVIRKHRLTEMFLHKVMGFGWEEVHEIAEQMEHINSSKFFDRMDQLLEYPISDPHGSPIPDANGNVAKRPLDALDQLTPGQKGKVSAVANSSQELLSYLSSCDIALGSMIELINIEPFDDSCLISCNGGRHFMISKKVAKCLLLQVV